jgi:hypothetical protein
MAAGVPSAAAATTPIAAKTIRNLMRGDYTSRTHLPNFRADARIRTADPFITSEVLYQLSYVGVRPGV